jgi:hypothetical protein
MSDIQHTSLILDSLEKFKFLNESIQKLSESIKIENPKVYVPEVIDHSLYQLSPTNELDQITMSLNDLWYREDENGVSTRKYKGIVICSQNIINLSLYVNIKKDDFAISVRKIRDLSNKSLNQFKYALGQYSKTRDELSSMNMSRLNLNHCYRHIHIFTEPPSKIQYSNSKNELSIKRISVKDAEVALEAIKTSSEHHYIDDQLNRLRSLRRNIPLAVVRSIAPHFKVNLFYKYDVDNESSYFPVTRKPGLPIFILDTDNSIDIRFEKKNKRKINVKTRSDKLLEDIPFLKSLSIYRYK